MTRIAFIGLGAMGGPMAARIAGGDQLEVVAYDLNPAALEAANAYATPASSVADAVAGADLICTMVPADRHLLALVDQVSEGGSPGQVFVDFSTVSPHAIQIASAQLGHHDIQVVGAACMKSVAAARAGQLSLYVGGPNSAIDALRSVFDRVASDWSVVDTPATAKMLKVANNLLTATTGYCLLEGIALAHALGTTPEDAVAHLRQADVGSWVLNNHIVKHALTGDLGPGIFSVAYMGKDLELATAVAEHVQRPAFYAALVSAAYRGLAARGYADHYHPIVVRWIAEGAGRGSITEPPTPTGVDTEPLWPAMRAVQTIAVDEALRIAEASGVAEADAIRLLQAGSAASDVLAARINGSPDWNEHARELSAVVPLLASGQFPGLSFVLGQQLAASRSRK